MISRDVLLHVPNNSGAPRLGGAAPEKFDAAEPDAEDSVELRALARGGPFKNDLREASRRAIRRRSVVGEDRRLAVRESEFVLKEEI